MRQSLDPIAAANVTIVDRGATFCVIGAGPSGLCALKNFVEAGIPVECLEASADLGGIWNYAQPSGGVYESTHLISSKRLTEYRDFPMPDAYPEYPSHAQALAYLRSYAERFDLTSLIRFGVRVERVEKSGESWLVRTNDGTTTRYRGVVIANGHHRTPNLPEWPGRFDGEILHSSAYKSATQLRGKRVLVVGAGNSGCDIAVDAAQHATSCAISLRRGYHFVPKFYRGAPIDVWGEWLLRWRVPLFLRRALLAYGSRIALGNPTTLGFPAPTHRFLETHPIINSQLLYFAGHGRIAAKPTLKAIDGRRVTFVDGTSGEFDLLVAATGYRVDFPFINEATFTWRDGAPRLWLHAFPPDEDALFVAGMLQTDSGAWGIVDLQTRLMARFVAAQNRAPAIAAWFRAMKLGPQPDLGNGVRYVAGPRHTLEVEHFSYRRRLEKLLARFDIAPARSPRD
ncbi:MAG: NAD(P)-binding domain-containing protein [Pirellulales bacterium]